MPETEIQESKGFCDQPMNCGPDHNCYLDTDHEGDHVCGMCDKALGNFELGKIYPSVQEIAISEIKIHPRQRKTLDQDNLLRLAASIEKWGLFHPVVIDREHNLLAGFRRLQAFLALRRDNIPFNYIDALDDYSRKCIELEENLQRVGLEWWEKAAAVAEIDELYRMIAGEEGKSWSFDRTADALGVSKGNVVQSKMLSDELKKNPKLREHKTASSAVNSIVTRKKLDARREAIQAKQSGLIVTRRAEIIIGDAAELIIQQPDESFDLVATNFPFGVDLEFKSGVKPYKDDEDYIVKLVREVTHQCYRVLKPDSWMIAFFDMRKITYSQKQKQFVKLALEASQIATGREEYKELAAESLGLAYWMEEAGFDYVQLLPCVWVKPNKTQGRIGDQNKGFIVAFEAFILAGKGEPILLKKGRPNIFVFDTPLLSERVHSVQMSEALCTELVAMTVLGGARVLDPFAGSGAFGLGALNNQCEFLGFEIDPENAKNGNLLLSEHLHSQAKEPVMYNPDEDLEGPKCQSCEELFAEEDLEDGLCLECRSALEEADEDGLEPEGE